MSPKKKHKGKRSLPRPKYRKRVGAKARAAPPHQGTRPQGVEQPADIGVRTQEPARADAAPLRSTPPRPPSTVVSLEPLAPVIVRSGRPRTDRNDADPAQFPPPSTVAGCLRTAWARGTGRPFGPELAELKVAGPLLLAAWQQDAVTDEAGSHRALAPKPADALYFGHGAAARCVRAEPRPFDIGCGADLPDGLLPVRLTSQVTEKPGDGPAWWGWKDLLAFRRGESVSHEDLQRNGWSPPNGDRRTHVTIDPARGTAATGELFQTEGLDLDTAPAAFRAGAAAAVTQPPDARGAATAAQAEGLRLLAKCGEALGPGLVHLGGKRRLAALESETADLWPKPPDGWLDQIHSAGGLCLTLLTPGIFSAGFRPGWLGDDLTGSPPGAPGLRLRLRAAAVERWQPHSGWDLARQRPRPTRKLAQAGAVYWFDVLDGGDGDTRASLWLASICDDEQDRRDGFGLALPAPWRPPNGAARA